MDKKTRKAFAKWVNAYRSNREVNRKPGPPILTTDELRRLEEYADRLLIEPKHGEVVEV